VVSKASTDKDSPKWKKSFELTKQMFEEASIDIEVL